MQKTINLELGHKHYAYPSIEQFRNVIYNVNNKATFVGLDENKDPIFDETKGKPTLTFVGSTKLHGTNASVVFDFKNEVIYYQSRENVISPAKDNAGFAAYMASIQEKFFDFVMARVDRKDHFDVVCVYGEWCGGSIQKGVALNGLDKMFVIFDVRLIKTNEDPTQIEREWFTPYSVEAAKFSNPELKIYSIYDFKTWKIDIDFNYPQLKQNELVEITEHVEEMCPVGGAFGHEGTGEGVVWKCITHPFAGDSGYWMKVKGEKHSSSKVKTIAAVDIERLNGIKEFIELAVTENRCKQSIEKLKEAGLPLLRTSLAQYLRWIHGDIIKEEMDTILANGFEVKELGSHISAKAREWFFKNEVNF